MSRLAVSLSSSLALLTSLVCSLTVEDVSQYGQAPDRLLEENLAAIEELERKKRARKLAHVPTDDRKVRAKLREMGEPITLFGEMVS